MIKIIREQEELLPKIGIREFRAMERKLNNYYDGLPLEAGETSIPGVEAKAIRELVKDYFGTPDPNVKILDYGAGEYERNSKFLRALGFTVYAYDPYNGLSGVDGYIGTSNQLPDKNDRFDIAFSSFVLNVVPMYIERDEIIPNMEYYADQVFHITRNFDIWASYIEKNLNRKTPMVMKYYWEANGANAPVTLQGAYELCHYGTATPKGFQRIPETERFGYAKVKGTTGYKIYKNK